MHEVHNDRKKLNKRESADMHAHASEKKMLYATNEGRGAI